MRHQDLQLNHRLESWVYGTAADRISATGFVSGDVGRVAYQSDTGEYYRLLSITPTWGLISIPVTVAYQGAQFSPTGTTSTTGVMMGFGTATYGTFVVTPARSGNVFVNFSGSINNTGGAGFGTLASLRYGLLPAPANGVAQTGTAFGPIVSRTGAGIPAGGAIRVPFSATAIITGLTPGTAIWVDVALAVQGAGTGTVETITGCAFELP